MINNLIQEFRKLLEVNIPIIFIHDFDFARVDDFIKQALGDSKIIEWNPATGNTRFDTKETRGSLEYEDLESFLLSIYKDELCKGERYIVLKEVHDYLDSPRIKALLQLIAQRRLYDPDNSTSIIIVSSIDRIPEEIKRYVSYLEIDYPTDSEIDGLIQEHIEVNQYDKFDSSNLDQLKLSLRGMSKYEIDRVLDIAMSSNGTLSAEDAGMILKQKKQMVKKSGTVELIDSPESIDDIGGLDALKTYLKQKAEIFRDWPRAYQFGVTMPKGVFIVGMPGCGKSLCAKATASIFNAPLLKLDMGSMMGKYVGQSEENLRNAIKIAEAAAPCILWIDEIEKAFSGVGGNNDILTRMFGYFLSWLQDKKSNVYVIATANNADNLPPELKRKGRFDEIFCVNLPNEKEREAIFGVHINKLSGKKCLQHNSKIDFKLLASNTNGFNGADIEAVVSDAVEQCFLTSPKKPLSTDTILDTVKNAVSISKSCAKQIESMRKAFSESSFKDATTGRMSK